MHLTHVIVFSSSSTNVWTLCAQVELIFSLRTGSHKTENNKVFYEFKIIEAKCMLAHLWKCEYHYCRSKQATYCCKLQRIWRISAQICNNTVVSHRVLPTRTLKKIGSKNKKLFFGWQSIKNCTFSASDRTKTFKNGFYARLYFWKQYGDKTKSSKKSWNFQFLDLTPTKSLILLWFLYFEIWPCE